MTVALVRASGTSYHGGAAADGPEAVPPDAAGGYELPSAGGAGEPEGGARGRARQEDGSERFGGVSSVTVLRSELYRTKLCRSLLSAGLVDKRI